MAAHSLAFQETIFDVVDRNGQPWLKAADIARALRLCREDSVSRIYDRNAVRFTDAMLPDRQFDGQWENQWLTEPNRSHILPARRAPAQMFAHGCGKGVP